MAYAPPPPPKNGLGHYRMLAPTASVRVSSICLGSMNFGGAWKDFMGECDDETVEEILDVFYENGGNFIDIAAAYQKGKSEQLIGQWMTKRGVRDQMVVATKYTTPSRMGFGDREIIVNTGGNGMKVFVSCSKSVRRTFRHLMLTCSMSIGTTSPAPCELMQSLNDIISSGKALYLGASNSPAWVVAKANQYARDHGLRQFSVYQGNWSAACRGLEREIIPMCISEGIGIMLWGSLGDGQFKSEEQRKAIDGRKFGPVSENVLNISKVLENLAMKNKTQITSIALAYVLQKTAFVFPIVGGRSVEQLKENIAALALELSKEDIDEIEGAAAFDLGFPGNAIGVSPET